MNTHGMLMVLLSITAQLGDVASVATLWARLLLSQMSLELVYALPAIALWHAPIQGWRLRLRREPRWFALLDSVAGKEGRV